MNGTFLISIQWRVRVCVAGLCKCRENKRVILVMKGAVRVVISGLILHEITNMVSITMTVGMLDMSGVTMLENLMYMSPVNY